MFRIIGVYATMIGLILVQHMGQLRCRLIFFIYRFVGKFGWLGEQFSYCSDDVRFIDYEPNVS